MSKRTAVAYLVEELSAILGPLETKPMQDLLMVDAINKAKQMEKKQIMNDYKIGYSNGGDNWGDGSGQTPEEYYNKIYRRK